jgi:hypothetical protein
VIASIDQSDLHSLIPADYNTHVHPDIKIYICGKFTKNVETTLDATDHTAGTNNFLHSLFSQCIIAPNVVNITLSGLSGNTFDLRVRCSYLTSHIQLVKAICCPVTPRRLSQQSLDLLPAEIRKNSRRKLRYLAGFIAISATFRILTSRRQATNKVYESRANILPNEYCRRFLDLLTPNCMTFASRRTREF